LRAIQGGAPDKWRRAKAAIAAARSAPSGTDRPRARPGGPRVRGPQCPRQGAEVTEIDLRSFDLPLYDGDLERRKGLPPRGLELREIFKAHPALLVGVTEYNGGITPLLKNAID